MKSRFVSIALFSLLSAAHALPASAGPLGQFFHNVVRDTKRRHCWPEPFLAADRHDVRAPLALMVHNGWRRQNMIGDHHFVDEAAELTQAGQLKVRWILTEAPQQHRTIYVHRAEDAETTAMRLDSVQQLAAKLAPEGPLPQVFVTDIPAEGSSASRVDAIGRRFDSATPDPTLPAAGGGSE